MPIAFQLARRTGTSPACLLMPLAFGSLLGGLTSLIGTSPNIIVSRMRTDLVGQPFEMFDFTPVGSGLAIAGVAFLAFGYRLLPRRKGAASIEAAFNIEGYTTKARLGPDSPMVGKTVADLEALGEGEVGVATIIRERYRRYRPAPHWVLYDGDLLILRGGPAALERLVARAASCGSAAPRMLRWRTPRRTRSAPWKQWSPRTRRWPITRRRSSGCASATVSICSASAEAASGSSSACARSSSAPAT